MSEEKTIEIPHTLALQFPVKWGDDGEISEVVVKRRLKAKDFKGIKVANMGFEDMIRLCVKVTGEPQAFIEELDSMDLFALIEVVNSFLPSTPEGGGVQ